MVASRSLSRQLAAFAHELTFDDLPDQVIDKAKALILHAIGTALADFSLPEVQETITLVKEEESVASGGSTIWIDGSKVTKFGAALVNYELCQGQEDSYKMLTHPGKTILPGAFAVLEGQATSGKDFLTAVVAGYEVQERLATDFVPSVMARGFHAGPAFGIFGPAVAAGKLMNFNEDQMNSAIALAVSLASGNLENSRSGGQMVREGASVRNALLAALLAQRGTKGGETTLEGDAGFYFSFTGNNEGRLSYDFQDRKTASYQGIVADLKKRWEILDTVHKVVERGAYNMPHVELMARICAEHNINASDVEHVELTVNWLETHIPTPAFPSIKSEAQRFASTRYFAAYGIATRDFPVRDNDGINPGAKRYKDPPEIAELMERITVIPSKSQRHLEPRGTVTIKDGRSYTAESTGREFMWNLNEEMQRAKRIGTVAKFPLSNTQYDQLVTAISNLENLDQAVEVIKLTVPAI